MSTINSGYIHETYYAPLGSTLEQKDYRQINGHKTHEFIIHAGIPIAIIRAPLLRPYRVDVSSSLSMADFHDFKNAGYFQEYHTIESVYLYKLWKLAKEIENNYVAWRIAGSLDPEDKSGIVAKIANRIEQLMISYRTTAAAF